MESVTLNVNEIGTSDRLVLERVLGKPLSENQKLVIQILSANGTKAAASNSPHAGTATNGLPEWCNVYEGLSDEEIASIESSILRSPGGRFNL